MKQAVRRTVGVATGAIKSLFKVSGFMGVSVCINLAGYSIAYFQERMLFIDTIGTALSSVAYGPIHGALVGVASNLIGSLILNGNESYIVFSTVHIWLALIWGLLPRLLNGLQCDFFNPHYNYRKLMGGTIIFGVLSAVITSVFATLISLLCSNGDCIHAEKVTHFEILRRAFYSRLSIIATEDILRQFLSDFIINLPDKLVSFGCAIFLIEKTLPERRLRLSKYSDDFISTNRRSVSIVILILFCLTVCYTVYKISDIGRINSAILLGVSALILFVIVVLLPFFLASSWQFGPDKRMLRKNVHTKKNAHSENVFDDTCKLAILYYIIIYISMPASLLKGPNDTDAGGSMLSDNLASAISVSVYITAIQFSFVVIGRYFEKSFVSGVRKTK